MSLNVHIINHTHWDREWFLTHVYTNAWIPGLIDRLTELAAANPHFQFLLDGQTLVIEDLLKIAPEYRPKVAALARGGHLLFGPYYCQPDWRLVAGEALLRNLALGLGDARRLGNGSRAGWLVDTFGHISQAPQLHNLFDLQTVYLWRGVPALKPFFHWRGPDGSRVLAVNVFGGYRNLYGVSHLPEVAAQRLEQEARRLQPFYPTPHIPLFDGYDLEDNPEDPIRFFTRQAQIPAGLRLVQSSPDRFAQVARDLPHLPTLQGELLSGKYGATFPGTLSARTYLKLMHHDVEHLLFRLAEPWAALASLAGRPYPAERFEACTRTLLRNAVHDCLCGVSIDLVHEKMEFTYQQLFQELEDELRESLGHLLAGFSPGTYALSTNPYATQNWIQTEEALLQASCQGVGIWPAGQSWPLERPQRALQSFSWQNDHYRASVDAHGLVTLGPARLGRLLVYHEDGDTYSEARGALMGELKPQGMTLESRSERHAVLRLRYQGEWDGGQVGVTARLHFDPSPLVRWSLELDSRGCDFRVEMLFDCGHEGQVYAGMPYDVVARPFVERDLLPRELPRELAGVLMGQREVDQVATFPFHDFVALQGAERTSAVLARGLRAYQAEKGGTIRLILRRSVEWLTRSERPNRVGDAGPFFYVPDARCERKVHHELAFVQGNFQVTAPSFQALNAGFQNPPLVVQVEGGGEGRAWPLLQADLPLSALQRVDDRLLVRLYNPAPVPHRLKRTYAACDVEGKEKGTLRVMPPKAIVTLILEAPPPPAGGAEGASVELLNPMRWRVERNRYLPAEEAIAELRARADRVARELGRLETQIAQHAGRAQRLLQHRYYILRREMLEYLLSIRLNEWKRAMRGQWSHAYLFEPDPQVAQLGLELNRMRIKRRIYDYVVRLEEGSAEKGEG
jgi:alpha-mannosidase